MMDLASSQYPECNCHEQVEPNRRDECRKGNDCCRRGVKMKPHGKGQP